jgi:hypothetical protein
VRQIGNPLVLFFAFGLYPEDLFDGPGGGVARSSITQLRFDRTDHRHGRRTGEPGNESFSYGFCKRSYEHDFTSSLVRA